jgi:very-short-patch-repair endonuclease
LPDLQVKFLRGHETLAEKRLWQQLRRKRIGNRRFRRQYRLGRYIVDFVCQGFRVIRFSNEYVLFNLDSVVRTIDAELSRASMESPDAR